MNLRRAVCRPSSERPNRATVAPPSGTGDSKAELLAEKLNVAFGPPPERLKVATQSPEVGEKAGFVLEIMPVPYKFRLLAELKVSTKLVRASEKPPTDQILPAGGLSTGLILIEPGVVTITPFPTNVRKSPLVEIVFTSPNVTVVEVLRLFGTLLVYDPINEIPPVMGAASAAEVRAKAATRAVPIFVTDFSFI